MSRTAIESPNRSKSKKVQALEAMIAQLERIEADANGLEADFADELAAVDPRFRDSARNLLHYTALRRVDLRPLQTTLASYGLSSLGRAEPHVMASLRAVQQVLRSLLSDRHQDLVSAAGDFATSNLRFEFHTANLLGPGRAERSARIMVTLPTEAAKDPGLVRRLVASGMDVARINCAHNSEPEWLAMVGNVRRACEADNRRCRIFMDLAGPKLRTGELAPGPQVLHIKPRRDAWGRVVAPRRLRLVPNASPEDVSANVIPVTDPKVLRARAGDCFRFRDTRGKKRQFRVVGCDAAGLKVECHKPAFIRTGTKLQLRRRNKSGSLRVTVGDLPAVEQPIVLRKGDQLVLHRSAEPGKPASFNKKGAVIAPARISCTLPEVFRSIRPGEPVFFNDGKIGGVVKSVTPNRMVIKIDKARPHGNRLRAGKSINFPDSALKVASFTDKDRQDLKFIAQHADAVGLSFARAPKDVYALQHALAELTGRRLGIVLKIETRRGFDNLLRLLLAVMRSYPAGVMIARGDLAVECGWERLAELQEEILWLCEAAQLPVIWGTQVLEGKTRKGMPSRAEISDAAMSQRADCVMLNKGPHVIEAMQMLDNILCRMQTHQSKKTSILRKLSITDVA